MGLQADGAGKSLERLVCVAAAPHPAGQLESAGFLEQACLLGLGLLPADAHVYPRWAGGTGC